MQHHPCLVLVCRPIASPLSSICLLFSLSLAPSLSLLPVHRKCLSSHLEFSPPRPGDAHSCTLFVALDSPSLHPGSSTQRSERVKRSPLRKKQREEPSVSIRTSGSEKETVSQLKHHAFPLPEGSFAETHHLSAGKRKTESSNDRNGNIKSNLFGFRSAFRLFPRGGRPRSPLVPRGSIGWLVLAFRARQRPL